MNRFFTRRLSPGIAGLASSAWVRRLAVALAGAVLVIGLGQLLALGGGSCAILCRPLFAGIYGAALGLLLFGGKPR